MNLKMLSAIFVVCFATSSYGQIEKKFFRKDYTYIEATDSFYKIHTIHRTWPDAKRACKLEDASLFYPVNDEEVQAVTTFWNNTQPFYYVYIGISDLVAKGVFVTVDGIPINDVYHKWGPGEPNDYGGEEDCLVLTRDSGDLNDDHCFKKFPFICKKSLKSLEWNQPCNMPNLEYKYIKDLDHCYKLHTTPLNWAEAYSVCSAEESYLAIINSEVEADYLELLANIPSVPNKGLNDSILLGFHNKQDDGWQTVRGGSLEDSGYVRWAKNQPDGGNDEQCGSMLFNGRLNDIGCQEKTFFICEHDVEKPTLYLDIRSIQLKTAEE